MAERAQQQRAGGINWGSIGFKIAKITATVLVTTVVSSTLLGIGAGLFGMGEPIGATLGSLFDGGIGGFFTELPGFLTNNFMAGKRITGTFFDNMLAKIGIQGGLGGFIAPAIETIKTTVEEFAGGAQKVVADNAPAIATTAVAGGAAYAALGTKQGRNWVDKTFGGKRQEQAGSFAERVGGSRAVRGSYVDHVAADREAALNSETAR